MGSLLGGSQSAKELKFAEEWFGYGVWTAPHWFVGPEPGTQGDTNEQTYQRMQAWDTLGGDELVDCRDHHFGFGQTKWHRPVRPPTQTTWRELIKVLFAFQARDCARPDNPVAAATLLNEIRAFQRDHWGRAGGETCVIELSPFAARSLKVPTERGPFLRHRVETLRAKLLRHRPKMVLMYGRRHLPEWRSLSGVPIKVNEVVRSGDTVFAVSTHPARPTRGSAHWVELGARMRVAGS